MSELYVVVVVVVVALAMIAYVVLGHRPDPTDGLIAKKKEHQRCVSQCTQDAMRQAMADPKLPTLGLYVGPDKPSILPITTNRGDHVGADVSIYHDSPVTTALHQHAEFSSLVMPLGVQNDLKALLTELADAQLKNRKAITHFWLRAVADVRRHVTTDPEMLRWCALKVAELDAAMGSVQASVTRIMLDNIHHQLLPHTVPLSRQQLDNVWQHA